MGEPTSHGLRKLGRRLFYVLVTFALLVLAAHVARLYAIERQQQAEYEVAKLERLERESQSKSLGQVVQSAVTVQSGLIAVNLILAFRGVQLWRLIQRIDLVEWIHRVSPAFPLTGRAVGAIRFVSMPVRRVLRPLRALPLRPLGALRARRAARAAAEAARRAALLEAARRDASAWGMLSRAGHSAYSSLGYTVRLSSRVVGRSVGWFKVPGF